jgi:glyoxylase-like metal-dependent hydrolase (beta-lactamase superfamily II)
MPAMAAAVFEQLDPDTWCIDALYTAPAIASCYLLRGDDCWALVETGTSRSVPNILATLDALDVGREQLRYIIPTHVHLDHAGGAGQLMRLFPDAELLIHPRGARHMIDPTRLVASSIQVYGAQAFEQLYGEIIAIPAQRVRTLESGETVSLGTRQLDVLHTRGHAEHHLCLFDRHTNSWFSGDMFGISYPSLRLDDGAYLMPATTPTQFDPALYAASLDALAARQPQRMCLTHYGALTFAPGQVDCLKRQLRAYASLAGEDHGLEALTAEVLRITRDELARLVSATEAERLAGTLSQDAQLNAQGIGWWRDHRAA